MRLTGGQRASTRRRVSASGTATLIVVSTALIDSNTRAPAVRRRRSRDGGSDAVAPELDGDRQPRAASVRRDRGQQRARRCSTLLRRSTLAYNTATGAVGGGIAVATQRGSARPCSARSSPATRRRQGVAVATRSAPRNCSGTMRRRRRQRRVRDRLRVRPARIAPAREPGLATALDERRRARTPVLPIARRQPGARPRRTRARGTDQRGVAAAAGRALRRRRLRVRRRRPSAEPTPDTDARGPTTVPTPTPTPPTPVVNQTSSSRPRAARSWSSCPGTTDVRDARRHARHPGRLDGRHAQGPGRRSPRSRRPGAPPETADVLRRASSRSRSRAGSRTSR